jgi:translation initiation factor eIF-2B subunit epsilon
VKERFAEDNVVIELNALKIAEDRTFADCARYILTTLLALCLPAPTWVSPEYLSLFATDVPDTNAKDGKVQLLTRFKKQMNKWQALLRRFLTSEDDQVRAVTHQVFFCTELGLFLWWPMCVHLVGRSINFMKC